MYLAGDTRIVTNPTLPWRIKPVSWIHQDATDVT